MTDTRRQQLLDLALATLLTVAAVAVFQRLIGYVFFHDDWTLLARAAGVLPHPEVPVRWLGFDGYWRFMGAVAGQNAAAYGISRLLLHLATGGAVAAVVQRAVAGRPAVAILAAALYLLTPLAFEALFWAAGVTELLAVCGLAWAGYGAVRGGRAGLAVFVVGAVASLLSKETGWWLALVAVAVWWRTRERRWLVAAVVVAAVAALALFWTSRGLAHDYAWTVAVVPWSVLRAGSWLVPRAGDLTGVWTAGAATLAVGAGVWLAWLVWAVLAWRRGGRWPAATLVAALLCLAPVLGLRDHLVPRYLLPVQACLAVGLATCLAPRLRRPRLVVLAVVVVLGAYTFGCQNAIIARRYAKGRPAHRLVAKENMVRLVWSRLGQAGVAPGVDLAFLRRPGDEVEPRGYVLDVIGHTWGPQLLLGPQSTVSVVDRAADVPPGAATFGFRGWDLEYLGVRRGGP